MSCSTVWRQSFDRLPSVSSFPYLTSTIYYTNLGASPNLPPTSSQGWRTPPHTTFGQEAVSKEYLYSKNFGKSITLDLGLTTKNKFFICRHLVYTYTRDSCFPVSVLREKKNLYSVKKFGRFHLFLVCSLLVVDEIPCISHDCLS